jgi:hypothetical protein
MLSTENAAPSRCAALTHLMRPPPPRWAAGTVHKRALRCVRTLEHEASGPTASSCRVQMLKVRASVARRSTLAYWC